MWVLVRISDDFSAPRLPCVPSVGLVPTPGTALVWLRQCAGHPAPRAAHLLCAARLRVPARGTTSPSSFPLPPVSSTVRALPFVHDTSKDAEGNPLKKYQRAGKKVTVGQGLTIETDAFVLFSAYDVRLAVQADLDQEAQQAHGEYLKRQAEYRRRSVQARIEKAKQLVEERRTQAKALAQASANGATAAAAGAGRKSA